MMFEWDEKKEQRNIALRPIPFDYGTRVFLDPTHITFTDNRYDYGEDRLITMGYIENRLYVVLHVKRDEYIRIISVRKANKREQRDHETLYPSSR